MMSAHCRRSPRSGLCLKRLGLGELGQPLVGRTGARNRRRASGGEERERSEKAKGGFGGLRLLRRLGRERGAMAHQAGVKGGWEEAGKRGEPRSTAGETSKRRSKTKRLAPAYCVLAVSRETPIVLRGRCLITSRIRPWRSLGEMPG